MVLCIISLYANNNVAMDANQYPLHKAAAQGNVKLVTQLIENNADVNQPIDIDTTSLHNTHHLNKKDVEKIKINGNTPLHEAAYHVM